MSVCDAHIDVDQLPPRDLRHTSTPCLLPHIHREWYNAKAAAFGLRGLVSACLISDFVHSTDTGLADESIAIIGGGNPKGRCTSPLFMGSGWGTTAPIHRKGWNTMVSIRGIIAVVAMSGCASGLSVSLSSYTSGTGYAA